MSEQGAIFLHRSIWDHELFVDGAPFSRREAWLWLISEAAWKSHRRRAWGQMIDLQRGQFAASLRSMGDVWRWSPERVRRFLNELKNETMIETSIETGFHVITICNYDRYQRPRSNGETASETADETAARQRRDTLEERKESKEKKESLPTPSASEGGESLATSADSNVVSLSAGPARPARPARARASPIPLGFDQFWREYPRRDDKLDAQKAFVRVMKAGVGVDTLIAAAQRYAKECAGKEKQYIKLPATWLNKGSWENNAPAPKSDDQIWLEQETERIRLEKQAKRARERQEQDNGSGNPGPDQPPELLSAGYGIH